MFIDVFHLYFLCKWPITAPVNWHKIDLRLTLFTKQKISVAFFINRAILVIALIPVLCCKFHI